jgi:hypothetical protein
MIIHQNGKFVVKDSTGKKTLGTHATHAEALAQLRAIEANKHKKDK